MKLLLQFDLEELRMLHELVLGHTANIHRQIGWASDTVKESMASRKIGEVVRPVFKHDQAEISDEITIKNEHYFRKMHLGLTNDRETIQKIHNKVEKAFDEVYLAVTIAEPEEGEK